ncbi:MAG: diadenylate cyclase [Verrucomicrobia bacterium]|nr:diadenylate cyclase [Verrucomicrobiota bacterium]
MAISSRDAGAPRDKPGAKETGRPRRRTAALPVRAGGKAVSKTGLKTVSGPLSPDGSSLSNMVIDHALEIADRFQALAVFISADLLPSGRVLDASKRRFDIYVVTQSTDQMVLPDAAACKVLKVPSIPMGRVGKIKVAMVMAASRGLLKTGDRVVCVSGLPEAGVLDTILVLQVGTETEVITTSDIGGFARRVKAGVFDTVLELALELANQGREGKPVGTIFVIGDTKALKDHVRQLVLNPFKGYSERQRQILDPSVRATIKEFSTIDGAFVIDTKGIVLSAGTYLDARITPAELPPGLGARHLAAASITAAVSNSIAIVVSESTGEVRVYRHGIALTDIEPGTRQPGGSEGELPGG